MFKRHRPASNPAPKQPPNASASLAATKAFMKNRESNGALSSAAAAAALRTHTTSPTPVGDTVTKRMVRKASTSSQGSGSQQAPGLRRHSSSGSMTERSFRAPSPNRASPNVDHSHDAPPVPAVPKQVPTVATVHRRASSLEPTYRGGSPVGRGGGRGSSLDRGVAAAPGRGQAHPSSRITNLSQVPEDDADGNPRFMNFSRPISPPQTPSSPRPSTAARGGHTGWHGGPVVNSEATFRGSPKARPKTSDGLDGFAAHSAQQNVQNAANRPVSTHRSNMSHGVEGARLATGSMRAHPAGSNVPSQIVSQEMPQPVDPKSPYAVYDPSTRTFIHKQAAMQRFRALSDEDERGQHEEYVAHQVPQTQPRQAPQPKVSQPASRPAQYETPPPSTHIRDDQSYGSHQQEHVTQEPPAHEERVDRREENHAPLPIAGNNAKLARQSSEDYAGADVRSSTDASTSHRLDTNVANPAQDVEPSPTSPKFAANQDSAYPRLPTPVIPTTTNTVATKGRGSVRSERTHSLSPPRNAHFSTLSVELPDGVRHQPPPRSVSPAKSALKSSPSISRRNSSPITNNGRVASRGASSEASDTMSDDGTRRRKRAVRVSFDEEAVIAGTSAYAEVDAPTSPSGLGQSRWSATDEEQDLDDVMKPRPALPSFGSIRGKSRRHDEDEVPEKVTETVSSSMSTSVNSVGDSQQTSSDLALGGILAHDFASKNTPQDPLPPEVTSVEGSGYVSDSSSSSGTGYDEVVTQHIQKPRDSEFGQRAAPETEPKSLTNHVESKPVDMAVPEIAIQPASPSPHVEKPQPQFDIEEESPDSPIHPRGEAVVEPEDSPETVPENKAQAVPSVQRTHIPGGWDEEESEPESKEPEKKVVESPKPETKVPEKTPHELRTETLNALNKEASAKPIGIYSHLQNRSITFQESDSSSDNSSIYSDAYEEFTDNEDGGFASIDAVVESPIVAPAAPVSGLMSSKYANQSPIETRKQDELPRISEDAEPTHGADGWNASRQHWNSVSEIQRQRTEEKPASGILKSVHSPQPAVVPAVSASTSRSNPVPSKPANNTAETTRSPKSPPPHSQQPRKSAMKKSTAPVPVASPAPTAPSQQKHIRQTMRSSSGAAPPPLETTGTHMRKSMRGEEPSSARGSPGLASSRHSMQPQPTKGALQKRNIPTAAPAPSARSQNAAAAAASRPKTAPAPTYDSDSDASVSSFQRERQRTRSARASGGRYTMRASMRGSAAPTMREATSPRPMSPIGKPSSPPPAAFRKSMRPSSPTPEVTPGMKSSRFSIRSLSPGGRFKQRTMSDEAPPLPVSTPPKKQNKMFGKKQKAPVEPSSSKPRYKSRFADSSDEDDDRPSRFQSRFADSDDDDDYQLPPGLAPVRGIPRKPGDDEDSTDLEEELSDEERPAAKSSAKDKEMGITNGHTNGQTNGHTNGQTNGQTNGRGVSFASGSLRKSQHAPPAEGTPEKKAKRGFFGLGKKKHHPTPQEHPTATTTTTEPDNTTKHQPPSSDIPYPPEHRNRALTPIGEDEDKALEANNVNIQPTSRSPKLQRRSHYHRSASDSWPLPQPTAAEEARPQSSDGIAQRRASSTSRPVLSKRFSSQSGAEVRTAIDAKTGKEVVVGRSGKKKKFQGLRRVFGLDN